MKKDAKKKVSAIARWQKGEVSGKTENESENSEEEEESEEENDCANCLIAHIANTQYDVVKEVLANNFDCVLTTEDKEWDIYWADTGVTSAMLSKMKPYQKINHYPGMYCVSRKNHLGRNLMRMFKAVPDEFNYFPKTWLLPMEWPEFRKQFVKNRTFILKPEALSQGKGIFLTRTPEGIDQNEHYVAQRYISKPYLIEGLKFDLRIYVLVYGCDPLRIFIYREGLARLATEQYKPPDSSNLDSLYTHLTNYAINKNNSNFVFNVDADHADVGHKRSLTFVWKYIDEHGGCSQKLKEDITKCIVKTMCGVQPLLAHSYRSVQPHDLSNGKCFEILGFDILLDHKLKPWLLEVNHSPSFTTDTPFDEKVKFQLLTDTLSLLNMRPSRREKFYRKRADKQMLWGPGKLTKEQWAEARKKKMEKRDKYEAEHLGDYKRVYPDGINDDYYGKIVSAATEVWEEFTGAKRKKELMKHKEEIRGKELKSLPGKKSNIVPKNRKPLYYIKKTESPTQQNIEADAEPEEMGKAECEDGIAVGDSVDKNKTQSMLSANFVSSEDIVDAIARKYNIVGMSICERTSMQQ